MHQKIIMITVLLVSLSGLMGEAQSSDAADPVNSARVRVYQEAEITLYPGEYCYGSDSPAAIHAAGSGFSIFRSNKRAGMPVTGDIEGAYNEYVIQAGIPVTVMLQWAAEKNGVQASCGPIGSTFYPQFGKNYDVTIAYKGNCFVQIRELYETSPGKAEARELTAGLSFACASK